MDKQKKSKQTLSNSKVKQLLANIAMIRNIVK